MKKIYNVSDDLFMVAAFVLFVVGVVLQVLSICPIFWQVTPFQLIKTAGFCLVFSIALSLRDISASASK